MLHYGIVMSSSANIIGLLKHFFILCNVSPQQCDGLVKGPCSGHLSLPYPSLHVSVWWLLWCNNRDGTAAHTAKICACACVHSLCKVFTCSWLVPFLILNIASVFVQGASVVWDWFTPTSRAQCRPSPSRTCPSTSTWLSSGRASLCSSSASSSAVTSSGEQEQSQHDTQLNSKVQFIDIIIEMSRWSSAGEVVVPVFLSILVWDDEMRHLHFSTRDCIVFYEALSKSFLFFQFLSLHFG